MIQKVIVSFSLAQCADHIFTQTLIKLGEEWQKGAQEEDQNGKLLRRIYLKWEVV